MRFFPLGVIVALEFLALALCVLLALLGWSLPYDGGLRSSLQTVLLSVSAFFGIIWFFVSLCAFHRCACDLGYAHSFTRQKSVMLLGWMGLLSAFLAVAALAAGLYFSAV